MNVHVHRIAVVSARRRRPVAPRAVRMLSLSLVATTVAMALLERLAVGIG